MAIAADGECGEVRGPPSVWGRTFLLGPSAAPWTPIGDAERDQPEGTGARFAVKDSAPCDPSRPPCSYSPCFGRASGLVAGEPRTPTPAAAGHVRRRRRRGFSVLVPVLREVERVAVPAAVRGDVHVVLVLLLVQRERVHLARRSREAALSGRASAGTDPRRPPREGGPPPSPRHPGGRDGGRARRQTSPGTPTATRTRSRRRRAVWLVPRAPDGDGEPRVRGLRLSGSAVDRVDGERRVPPPRRRARSRSRTGRAWISRGSSRWISASAADHPEPPTRDRSRRAPGNLERRAFRSGRGRASEPVPWRPWGSRRRASAPR